ncbi:hypothetical protein HPB48_003851 [Haemaphysalis longicornis]|uniref:Uncharacterized protein n=1 Tax=Haemaphysalis longicornis TaxID=44386 RepID=A0A9J6FLD2_HAELO|nr:hypothetical protein HPB48_003851 [Haemaphysalis longicornis]
MPIGRGSNKVEPSWHSVPDCCRSSWHEYRRTNDVRLSGSHRAGIHKVHWFFSRKAFKNVNRIIQAFKYEGRARDAPGPPPPRVTTEDEDACTSPSSAGPFSISESHPAYFGPGCFRQYCSPSAQKRRPPQSYCIAEATAHYFEQKR